MRRGFFIAVLFLLLGTTLFAQEKLTWSLALIKDNEGIPFSRPIAMQDGDTFSLFIQANQACNAYIIAQDSERQMIVLLDKRLAADGSHQTNSIKLIPPAGTEIFHIVMSLEELPKLENAIKAFTRQNNTRTYRDLNNAIAAARRSASQFKENPEKPVGMGGVFRGAAHSGTEFSGAGIYVKTIVINH
jgi:hypothetical protein